jgi:hypothetical protein
MMAIYTPGIDYSATANAIARENNVKQIGHSIDQQNLNTLALKRQGQSLDLQQRELDVQRDMLAGNIITQITGQAMSLGTTLKAKAQQAEMATAKTSADDAAAQFREMIAESILNGGTKAVQGADGVWDIQMDPGLEQWRTSQMEAIAASSDSKEVKQWRMQTLSDTYASGQSQVISGILNQTQATIEQQYDLNLASALQTDAKTGSYEMGAAVISGRSDYSDLQKQVAFASYQKSVDKRFQTTQVSNLAFTEGIDKATEYAYGLKGFSPEEIQGFVATAARTDQQVTAAIATSAASVMSKGLEAGASPAELYKAVEDRVDGMPEDRRQAAIETAKATHIAWATKQGYALANADLQSVDAGYLTRQRDSITKKGGPLHQSIFDGLDQTAATFGAMYDRRIDELNRLEKTQLENLSKAQIKENKTILDASLAMLKNGDISPAMAMQAVRGLNANATESDEDDLYQIEMLTKINDEIVPERYKPLTTKFLSEMESLKIGLTDDSKKGMTAEQTIQIAEARDYANTAIANIFMNTAANEITPKEVADQLGMIKSTFIAKSVKALESGEVVDKLRLVNDPDATDDALDKLHQFGGLPVIAVQMDKDGAIQWSNPEYKATYDAVAGQIANELQNLGIQVTSESSPLMVNRVPKPIPTFRAMLEGGEAEQWVTVNKGDVFTSTDGKSWYKWKTIDTKAKFKTETPVDKFFDQFRTKQSGTRAW